MVKNEQSTLLRNKKVKNKNKTHNYWKKQFHVQIRNKLTTNRESNPNDDNCNSVNNNQVDINQIML